MKFIEFNSVTNLTERVKKDLLEGVHLKVDKNQSWMVTEKVHGANFSFYCDGKEVKCANRSAFIVDGQKFYNAVGVFNKYKDSVLAYHKKLLAKSSEVVSGDAYLILYGELFGGSVQKGMPYPEEQDFLLFDVLCVAEDNTENRTNIEDYIAVEGKLVFGLRDKTKFIPVIAKEMGMKYAEPLFVGTLEDCLNFNCTFPTTYADEDRINNSGIKSKGKEAFERYMTTEGVVIEPTSCLFHNNDKRIMYKNKTKRFQEKTSVVNIEFRERVLSLLSAQEADALTEIDQLVTKNRFDNVVSKLGEVNIKDFNKVFKEFLDDVMKEADEWLFEVYQDDPERFEVKEFVGFENHKDMLKIFNKEVQNFVRKELLELS